MSKINKLVKTVDILYITTIFFLLFANVILYASADHEASIPDPNDDIDFFISKIMPACDFYKSIGLKPIGANCSEWYQTHEGHLLVVEYMMKK